MTDTTSDSSFDTEAHTDISRSIQRRLLPSSAPRVEGYDVAAGTTTEEGGQGHTVWDSVALPDGTHALMTYHVVGVGAPPAVALVAVRALVRAATAGGAALDEAFRTMNAGLSRAIVAGVEQFVACGVARPHADGLEWVGAGRVPAGVIRRAGTFEELPSHGPPLGMMEGFQYAVHRVDLGPGDNFLLMSHAPAGLFRGAADLVAQVQGKTAGEVVTTLHRGIRKAQGESPEETSVVLIRKH